MKATLAATTLAVLLATAGAAVLVVKVAPDALDAVQGSHAGADVAALQGGQAGDGPHAQLGMDRPRFPPATGSVPSSSQARDLDQVRSIDITNDTQFNPGHGVRSGSGTLADPYVISGYDVTGELGIYDTDACFEVKDNWIDGVLRLNWNGPCVFVHHNFIRDLRVNENIRRTGMDTGGLIELNSINYVGQIRHFDGEFRNNVVGPREDARLPWGIFEDPENLLPFAKDTRVMNVDGWNEALFHHNTIVGSVDLKLHGHHHSTGFLATHSHYHGTDKSRMTHMEDHTLRWSSVSFAENLVTDPDGYGIRYTDEQHAGDDRTAPSEATKELDEPHVHHTYADIRGNTVEGAGILVDVFNADDRLHKQYNPGWLDIVGNTIHIKQRQHGVLGGFVSFGPFYFANTGIRVFEAKEVQLLVAGNHLSFEKGSGSPTSTLDQLLPWFAYDEVPYGILLDGIRDANVTVAHNQVSGFDYGVAGSQMDARAFWAVYGNDFGGAPQDVYYDDSVANKPQTEPFPPAPGPYDGAPGEDRPEHQHH